MSQTVERRIVDIQFNNGQFEKNVGQTLSTLDKLKASLTFKGFKDTFSGIEQSSKGVKLSSISGAVETVKTKFSVLETIAVGALLELGRQAVNTGEQLVRSLSIDQVTAGWSKYAEKTTAVQTIMAATRNQFENTEEQMAAVNEQISRLNWFSDETSYSLLDMTSNLGKFTSNNVKLETAATAMQGISTWAAISGQRTAEASRAMYNLSQALGTGYVQQVDWRSIENANMATSEFKQTVIDTAVELGMLKKQADGTITTLSSKFEDGAWKGEVNIANFRENLKTGWFTQEVLLKTLDKYGAFTNELYKLSQETGMTATEIMSAIEDFENGTLDLKALSLETGTSVEYLNRNLKNLTSSEYDLGKRAFKAAQEAKTFEEAIEATKDAVSTGWMTTFETIFGDYEKARHLWTSVSENLWELFNGGAEARNKLLDKAFNSDYWNKFLKDVQNTAKGAEINIHQLTAAEEEYRKGMGLTIRDYTVARQKARDLGISLSELSEFLNQPSGHELLSKSIQNLFDWVLQLKDLVKEAWADVFGKTTAEQIHSFLKRLEEATANLSLTDEQASRFKTTLKGIFSILDIGKYILESLWKGIKNIFDIVRKNDVGDQLDETGKKTKNIWEIITDFAKSLREKDGFGSLVFKISDKIGKVLKWAITGIKKTINGTNSLGKVIRSIYGFFALIVQKAKETFTLLFSKVNINKDTILGALGVALDYVAKAFVWVTTKIEENWPAISKFLENAFEWFKSLWGKIKDFGGKAIAWISSIFEKIKNDPKVRKFFSDLKDTLASIWGWVKEHINAEKIGGVFTTIAGAIGGAVTSITDFFNKLKEKGSDSEDNSTLDQLSSMSEKLGEVADDVEDTKTRLLPTLTTISDRLKEFFGKVGEFMTADPGGESNLSLLGKWAVIIAGYVGISKVLKGINSKLEETTAPFKLFEAYSTYLKKEAKVLATRELTKSILRIAAAIAILAASIYLLSTIDSDKLWQSVGVLGGFIVVMVAAAKILGAKTFDDKKLSGSAVGILIMASAFGVLTVVIERLSKLDFMSVTQSLSVMGGLVGLAILISNFAKPAQLIGAAGALAGLGTAMALWYAVLRLYSSLDIKGAVTAMAEILIFIEGFNLVTKSIKPADWVKAAAAMAIMSGAVSVLAIALGVLGSMNMKTSINSLVVLAGSFLVLIGTLYLLNKMSEDSSEGIIKMASSLVILSSAAMVMALALKVLSTIEPNSLAYALLAVAGAFLVLIGAAYLAEKVAPGIEYLTKVLVAVSFVAVSIGASMIMFGLGLNMVATAIDKLAPRVNALKKILKAVLDLVVEYGVLFFAKISVIVTEWLVETLTALIPFIGTFIPMVVDVVLNLIDHTFKALVAYAPTIVENIATFIIEIVKALAAKVPEFIVEVVNLFMAILQGFIDAVNQIDPDVLMNGLVAISLVETIMLEFAALGLLFPASLAGVLAFGTLSAELILVLAGIGEAFGGEGMIESLTSALKVMTLAGESISNFTSSLESSVNGNFAIIADSFVNLLTTVIGLVTGTTFDLSNIIKFQLGLNQLGSGLVKFADTVSTVDSEKVNAVANAGKAVAEFAKSIPRTGGLGDILGPRDFGGFCAQLAGTDKGNKHTPGVGENIAKFYEDIKIIDEPSKITDIMTAMLSLTAFAKSIPRDCKWWASIFGSKELGGFVAKLAGTGEGGNHTPGVGENIAAFYNSIKSIPEEGANKISGVMNAMLSLSEFARSIPNSGGKIAELLGDNELGGFCAKLAGRTLGNKRIAGVGENIAQFYEDIKGIDNPNQISRIMDAALKISTFANSIPNSGGKIAELLGDNELGGFAEKLPTFGGNLKLLYDKSLEIKEPDKLDRIIQSANKIVELSNAIPETGGWLQKIVGESDLASFSSQFSAFGTGLASFIDNLNGHPIDDDAYSAVENVAPKIVSLATTLKQGTQGLKGALFEGENLDTLGSQLAAFAQGLVNYSTTVSGEDGTSVLNEEAAETSIRIAEKLIALQNENQNLGGFISIFTGSNDLSKFGNTLGGFASGLCAYSKAIADENGNSKLNEDAVESSIAVASSLMQLSQDYNKEIWGFVDLFVGFDDLATFGFTLGQFGKGIVKFSDAVTDDSGNALVNETSAGVACNVAAKLIELQKGTTDIGGAFSWFTGNNGLNTFGNSLEQFGLGLVKFNDAVTYGGYNNPRTKLNVTSIDTAISVAGKLMLLQDSITVDNYDDLYKHPFSVFGNACIVLGNSLVEFETSTKGIDQWTVTLAISRLTDLAAMCETLDALSDDCTANFVDGMKKLGETSIEKIVDGFADPNKSVTNAITTMLDNALTSLSKTEQDFYTKGETLATKIANGLKSEASKSKVKSAARALASAIQSALSNSTTSSSSSHKIQNAGRNIGKDLLAGTEDSLGIHSPSRAYENVVLLSIKGLLKGAQNNATLARIAGEEIGEASLDGTRSILANISEVISSDIDLNPTITPVLDLSEVTSGSRAIGQMLGGSRSLSLSRGVASMFGKVIELDEANSRMGYTEYNFTQNNYSPKALSTSEIYRQTKNQFSVVKKL